MHDYDRPPSPFPLDPELAKLMQDLRDTFAGMLDLITRAQSDPRLAPDEPALPAPHPIETAPGDHRLAAIGYVLVQIETDPITGLDTVWYWQRSDPLTHGEC